MSLWTVASFLIASRPPFAASDDFATSTG